MRINELEVKNFKLFQENTFSLDNRFNLIIGENGSGKTSLLRAVAVALGGWAHAFIKDHQNRRPIADDEVREVQIDNRFDKAKTTSITAKGASLNSNSIDSGLTLTSPNITQISVSCCVVQLDSATSLIVSALSVFLPRHNP